MADWNDPTLTSTYASFLATMKARDEDAACMAEGPTNPPIGFIRWNISLQKFQRWGGGAWSDLVLSATGGGTGGTAGMGTMAPQNANAVAITGGTIAGVSLSMAGDITVDADGTRTIGEPSKMFKGLYLKTFCVIPVGVDKWAP